MADSAAFERFAASLLDPALPVPPGLLARPGADVARRFAVYRNNVAMGLVEALREAFPVTERIVGEAFFRAMARAFAADCRPATPLLFGYGDAFPDFVAAFAPADPLPYLASVAAVEAARIRAFHAAEGPVLDAAVLANRLAGRSQNALLAIRIAAHPAAAVVASGFPVAGIWAAHQDLEKAPAFAGPWQAEAALVTRPQAEVRVRALDAAGGVFAKAMLQGCSVGEAGAAALDVDDGFDVGGAFVALAGAGAMAEVTGEVR